MELRVTKEKEEKPVSKKSPETKSKKSNIHKDHRSRLKNQFIENGIDTLTDIQKLELLLFYSIPQKDTNPIAHNLINAFGTLSDVMSASFNELIKVDGVKENSATLIKFFGSMLNYSSRPDSEEILSSSSKAKEFITKYFNHISVEQFYVFCLTKSNCVKKAFLINSGSSSEVNVEIRNITEKALETNCNRMIIAHNHPYGPLCPTEGDRATNSMIQTALSNVGVLLAEHYVVCGNRYVGFMNHLEHMFAGKPRIAKFLRSKMESGNEV
jgi:DNA repair protein RadC